MTEAARQINTGRKYSGAHRKAISQGNLSSEARKAHSESRRNVPRSDETKQRMSESMTGMERLYARGKPSPNSRNGHFGISWRADSQKWAVRLPSEQDPKQDRKFGSYDDINDALARRDEILAMGVDNAVANNENAGRKVLVDPATVRTLLESGMKPVAIQRELGISKPTYYRLVNFPVQSIAGT